MRKLILLTFLSVFSALAFSQELPTAETPATTATQGVPTPSNAVEQAAGKFGAWLGGVVKAPVDVVKSFATGVKSGLAPAPSPDTPPSASLAANVEGRVPADVKSDSKASSARSAPTAKAARTPVRRDTASVFGMTHLIGTQAPAPIVDRSIRSTETL